MKRWHAVWAGLSSQSYPMMEIIFTVLCSKSAITSGDFRSACIMTPRCMEKKKCNCVLCVKDNESYLSTAMATEKHNLHRLYKTQLTSASP